VRCVDFFLLTSSFPLDGHLSFLLSSPAGLPTIYVGYSSYGDQDRRPEPFSPSSNASSPIRHPPGSRTPFYETPLRSSTLLISLHAPNHHQPYDSSSLTSRQPSCINTNRYPHSLSLSSTSASFPRSASRPSSLRKDSECRPPSPLPLAVRS
jgi:hypothetical protein